MSEPIGSTTLDPKAAARRQLPRTLRPHLLHPTAVDPVTTRAHKPFLMPGNVTLFTVIAVFALYASGRLPQLDRFFDHLQNFGRAHNDMVVGSILHWLPVMLVGCSVLVLSALGFVTLRRRAALARPAAASSGTALDAVGPNSLQSNRPEATEPSAEVLAPQVRDGVVTVLRPASQPHLRPTLVIHRESPREVALEQADAALAEAPPIAAAPLWSRSPQYLSDSTPTLPLYHPPRPREARGTLPPAVAAALKAQVAAGSAH